MRGDAMDFRQEVKHEINYSDMLIIRQRLNAVAYHDPHAVDGKYFIRSLYFDNLSDKALMEKVNGMSRREKFRIRYYNGDTSVIHLEKKSKIDHLGNKQSAPLTALQAQSIVDGDTKWMLDSEYPLIKELYSKMRTQGIAPKTIVDYTREPFIYPAGNVRVTLDYNVRSGMRCTDFLDKDCVTVPVSDSIILEVKWDGFLPDIIRDAVALADRREGAFSKYAACRIYG
jgi:SPX domain protein involved in polyphosphate accumulation